MYPYDATGRRASLTLPNGITVNLYRYVLNSPVKYVEPYGANPGLAQSDAVAFSAGRDSVTCTTATTGPRDSLGTDTKLRIVNDIPTEQTTLHGKFRADVEGPYGHPPDSIFTTLSEGEDGADNNKKALLQQFPEKVVVRGVYLVRYQHLDENCGGAIPPPTAPGTGGGDQ